MQYTPVFYSAYPDETVLNLMKDLDILDHLSAATSDSESCADPAIAMSAAPAPTLDFQDIQGVVLNGYGHLNYSRFVLLKIIDAQSARRWLAHIANEISSAKSRRGEDELPGAQNNIAFAGGLEKLGLPRDTLAAFPREFQMGIAASGAIAQAW